MTGRKGKSLTALVALPAFAAVLVLSPQLAQAGSCTPAQTSAFAIKTLQTNLMVAALACGERAGYNAFISKFRPHLAPQGAALKAAFTSAYGNGGTRRLDAFVTGLANSASQSHIRDVTGFCAQAAADFVALSQAEGQETLQTLAYRRAAGTLSADLPCQPKLEVSTATGFSE